MGTGRQNVAAHGWLYRDEELHVRLHYMCGVTLLTRPQEASCEVCHDTIMSASTQMPGLQAQALRLCCSVVRCLLNHVCGDIRTCWETGMPAEYAKHQACEGHPYGDYGMLAQATCPRRED